MKLYDVMKKWATNQGIKFYCHDTDEIWKLVNGLVMTEENEERRINELTLNFNFEEVKEPVSFMEVLEGVIKNNSMVKVEHALYTSDFMMLTGLLDEIVSEIGYYTSSTDIARILTEGKFYIDN